MAYLGNQVAPLVQALEGKELKLDSDGDSSITADTDDRVDVKVGGSDKVHVTSTGLGIGTSSPSATLQVEGTTNGLQSVFGLDSSGLKISTFQKTGNDAGVILDAQESSNGTLTFATSGTEAMRIDATGAITKPLQPAFLAYMSATQSNFAINGGVTILFDTERFDQNADFNTSTYTFTAPVTGRYQLNLQARLNALDTAANYYQLIFKTSNTDYIFTFDPNLSADADYYSISFSILADMDASDIAYVQVNQSGGSQQTDINHGGDSYFSGYLVA
jgi:hypothetical protein